MDSRSTLISSETFILAAPIVTVFSLISSRVELLFFTWRNSSEERARQESRSSKFILCRSKCSSLGKRAEVLCEENRCLIEPELMEEVNLQEQTLGWQVGNYSEFWGRTLQDGVELRLGTLNPSRSVSINASTTTIYLVLFYVILNRLK